MEISEEEFFKKRNALLLEESANEVEFHWLSFADQELPEGSQFLGVAIVRAAGFVTAVGRTVILGINPGGECKGVAIRASAPIPESYLNRLLNIREVEELDALMTKFLRGEA